MDFKIKGGTPTSASDIKLWNSSLSSVITDVVYGKVYVIKPNGFMTQFIYTNMNTSSVKLSIEYKLVGTKETFIILKMLGGVDANSYSKILLAPSNQYNIIELELPMPETAIDSLLIEITNITSSNLQVAYIDIAGVITETTSTIDVSEFANLAIIYGTDANKPKLR